MVRDLPPHANEIGLKHYFSNYGHVIDVYLPKDPTTGAFRGFAYVKFETADSITKILEGKEH